MHAVSLAGPCVATMPSSSDLSLTRSTRSRTLRTIFLGFPEEEGFELLQAKAGETLPMLSTSASGLGSVQILMCALRPNEAMHP